MKVKVQTLDGAQKVRLAATSSSTTRFSPSSRAPTSFTASSPGSSTSVAAPLAPPVSAATLPAPARSSARQKGGGTARHGDRRAPIFIGGGKAHGPRVRDFDPSLNKKVRALGLRMALSSKAKDGNLVVLDNLDVKDGKTKALREQLGKLGFGKTALVIDGDALNVGFARASSNLESINLLPAVGANVYDIMRHDTLVLTRAAVEKLEARFNG